MKTLYLECNMGAAGNMLTAALLELMPDKDAAVAELNAIGIPNVVYSHETMMRCGIRGTHMSVKVNGEEEPEAMHDHHHNHKHKHHHDHQHEEHHHHHTGMHRIEHIVRDHLNLPKKVKDDVLTVYGMIAEAESHAHGVPVADIHFHEVGTMDALADVSAVCLLLYKLAPEQIIASPVCVGSGEVCCAHGILPVPTPATAYLLQGIPFYNGVIKTELCTPTGAALLRHFVTEFGEIPVLKSERIGYGMGTKEFDAANCLCAFWGETARTGDTVAELCCNLDDMTAESMAFAMEALLGAGAMDVWYTPITMKKSRPGTLLTVLCRRGDREEMVRLMFRHTTTIGVRESLHCRYALERTESMLHTSLGGVRCKTSSGYGVTRMKCEYEDLVRIAKEKDLSLSEVRAVTEDGIIGYNCCADNDF